MFVEVCPTENWDAELETCSATQWVEVATLVEEATTWLDVPGAISIAVAIGSVWAFAWTFRALAQHLRGLVR